MATLRIKVSDKKFVWHNNVRVEEFHDRYVRGNGWICIMHKNGDFHCVATGVYKGTPCRMKFKIEEGHQTLTLKTSDKEIQLIKEYEMDKWPDDGIIGLTSGLIPKRNAYFRDELFQEFLDEYGITSVKSTEADFIYPLEQKVCRGVTVFEETIETDGRTIQIFEAEDYPNEQWKNVYQEIEVTGATWVIKKVFESGNLTHKILYTDMDLKEIQGLPK